MNRGSSPSGTTLTPLEERFVHALLEGERDDWHRVGHVMIRNRVGVDVRDRVFEEARRRLEAQKNDRVRRVKATSA